MKTEQAHSLALGRDAALRRPGTAQRAAPTVWLNLVCLDAPIVAIAWLWLFARTFNLPVQSGNAVALFLTAWLIYLADRLGDALLLKSVTPRSLRQEFCLRHREIWISALILIGGFDVYVIWRSIAAETVLAGAVIGILAVVYLTLNYPRGLVWRSVPAKEVAIGLLFTAGTLVALLPGGPSVTPAFIASGVAFACLCTVNCISIAVWERQLDQAQGKVSVATRYPSVARHMRKVCGGLAVASFVLAILYRPATPAFGCVGVSAALLVWLHASADFKEERSLRIDRDRRTALADLVLLTPIIPLIATAL